MLFRSLVPSQTVCQPAWPQCPRARDVAYSSEYGQLSQGWCPLTRHMVKYGFLVQVFAFVYDRYCTVRLNVISQLPTTSTLFVFFARVALHRLPTPPSAKATPTSCSPALRTGKCFAPHRSFTIFSHQVQVAGSKVCWYSPPPGVRTCSEGADTSERRRRVDKH